MSGDQALLTVVIALRVGKVDLRFGKPRLGIGELGAGLVEVMAIGTGIKKQTGVATQTEQLIPQAIIRDRDTFFEQAPVVPGMAQPRNLERS